MERQGERLVQEVAEQVEALVNEQGVMVIELEMAGEVVEAQVVVQEAEEAQEEQEELEAQEVQDHHHSRLIKVEK